MLQHSVPPHQQLLLGHHTAPLTWSGTPLPARRWKIAAASPLMRGLVLWNTSCGGDSAAGMFVTHQRHDKYRFHVPA